MTDCAVVAIRGRILKRARDPRLMLVPGLADDLLLIGEAFGSLELSVRAIARTVLAKAYGYDVPQSDYAHLAELAREPEGTHVKTK